MSKCYGLLVIFSLFMFVAAVPQSAHAATLFSENFDGYTPGSYPPAPWTILFDGASGAVSTIEARSATQSFRSESLPNWARWDYVALGSVPDFLMYRASIFLTAADRGGAVGFGFLQPGISNTGWWANAVYFGNDGNVYFSTRTAGAPMLGSWTSGTWYDVEVRIDYIHDVADVLVNGLLVGDDISTDPKTLPPSVYGTAVPLDQFGMFGQNFGGAGTSVIYYDDLLVATSGPVATESSSWGRIKSMYED